MKKEFLIFIVLISVAAIISGATMALASNFSIINEYVQREAETNIPPDENTGNLNVSEKAVPEPAVSRLSINYNDDSDQILTPYEQEEIMSMLQRLGANVSNDFFSDIQTYQSQNSLSSSGLLTNETLELIVKQMAEQQLASNGYLY
ncbi:MAG: hypothetical protein LBR98_03995 [Syntrophomonadaceae bacterium]|jgi:hypothetical protein|nr:hypothetical protein [Syntrophomonadaceae bacterium]